ncbi:unnamed protein product [Lactuca virosa]|uniref:Uncharacterized protein n=1 Tax=Lactuca virosa TaxID=75947 RepID=A0AAU9N805_9ASTR|nr:unnamed protein product [Lactuca virosa]
MVFCDDEDENLGGFTYSPFQIWTESEDEVQVTKGQLQSLHEKIDQLILSIKASSTDAYAKAVVESLFEQIMKQHSATVTSSNNVVVDSVEVCKSTTKKVYKLIGDTNPFMEKFQTTFNSNTTSANEALKSSGSLFKIEKTKLQEIRTGLKTDHESFQATISSQLYQLKDELVKESTLKNSLALKSEEAKVLSTKHEASEKQVHDLLSERAIMRSCITDITGMLSDIIETRDSMITNTMSKHLAEKLKPIFAMLHRLEGVSDQSFHPKQGGESAAGDESKGKEKLFRDESILDNEDEEEATEEELKRRKVREAELDEH